MPSSAACMRTRMSRQQHEPVAVCMRRSTVRREPAKRIAALVGGLRSDGATLSRPRPRGRSRPPTLGRVAADVPLALPAVAFARAANGPTSRAVGVPPPLRAPGLRYFLGPPGPPTTWRSRLFPVRCAKDQMSD